METTISPEEQPQDLTIEATTQLVGMTSTISPGGDHAATQKVSQVE
jgi:hypothetical protein